MTKYTLAITGSKSFSDWDTFLEGIVQVVEQTHALPTRVVSDGTFSMAIKWAKDNNIKLVLFRPKRTNNGKKQPQDDKLIDTANHLLLLFNKKEKDKNKHLRILRKKMLQAQKHVVCLTI